MIVDALAIERTLNRTPLFQVSFVHQNMPQAARPIGDLVDQPFARRGLTSRFDLSIVSLGATFELIYNEDLFDRWQIEQLADQLVWFLREALREPERPLSRIATLPSPQREQLIHAWNHTPGTIVESTLAELFEAQVDRTPDATALVLEATQLTYRALEERSNQIAWGLRERGIGPEAIVGISLERSFDLVATILGVTKAGGAWVPLDPLLPAARRDYIVDIARPTIVITELDWAATRSTTRPPPTATAANLAYVLFTSGSTGRPKGVMIDHRGIVNELISAQTVRAQLDGNDAFLQLAPYTFDLSVHEMLWPLTVGARVVLLHEGDQRDPRKIVEEIRARGVTILHPVPTLLRTFARARARPLPEPAHGGLGGRSDAARRAARVHLAQRARAGQLVRPDRNLGHRGAVAMRARGESDRDRQTVARDAAPRARWSRRARTTRRCRRALHRRASGRTWATRGSRARPPPCSCRIRLVTQARGCIGPAIARGAGPTATSS